MNYLIVFGYLVALHLAALVITATTGSDYGDSLSLVAICGLSVLAADFYKTKEGR